jgi:predicted acetyltransferase
MRLSFGSSLPSDEELAAGRLITEFDRTLAFFDGPEMVATAGIFTYEMTVPGGALACGGVTRVSVLSTHRRRGLLTAMMRRQMDDMHERGEPLAALYASEAPIYGRFGYGLATYQAELDIVRSHASFASTSRGSGRLVMVDVPTATSAFTRVWDAARRDQPGMLRLDERWIANELADLELHRNGASPQYRVLHETDGKPSGFAIYRIKMDWDAAGPNGELRLEWLIATTAEAYAALWHYLLEVDLIARVTAEMRPVDEPLRFLLTDSRQPKTRIEDGIWLRLVDVSAALSGRRYAVEGRLALRVHDAFCPWNDRQFELLGGPDGAECRTHDGDPDLAVDVADLGALYLGGNRLRTLADAGRVQELRSGAIARADGMFGTDRVPWCPSHF